MAASVDLDDTIAAVATPLAGGLRGVVRISGRRVLDCLRKCVDGPTARKLAAARDPVATLATLRLRPSMGALECRLLFWPGRRSYTREPSAELHCHGAVPLVSAVLDELVEQGARLARPGEFTLRAFLAGRIDLVQAAAVMTVVDASSHRELDFALGHLAGGLGTPLMAIRTALVYLLAEVEAGLDFVDQDIQFIEPSVLCAALVEIADQLDRAASQLQERMTPGGLPRVVLCGRTNAGKSSLLNALARRHVAVVSDLPGTTRDHVTVELTLTASGSAAAAAGNSVDVEVIDTAGREPDALVGQDQYDASRFGAIDRASRRVAGIQADAAHLVVLCLDASQPLAPDERAMLAERRARQLVVLTKCDLVSAQPALGATADCIQTSARTGEGLDELRARVAEAVQSSWAGSGGAMAAAAGRCRAALADARQSIAQAIDAAQRRRGDELVAEDLRRSVDAIGELTGAVSADEILDNIFSKFCIGK